MPLRKTTYVDVVEPLEGMLPVGGVNSQWTVLEAGAEGTTLSMFGNVPTWLLGFIPFAATPTAEELPVGRFGLSYADGVFSLHVNDSGTIKTLSLGEPN